ELYAVNLGTDPIGVSVDGRSPVEVPPEGYRRLDLVGGTSRVVVDGPSGDRHAFSVTTDHSHALVKVSKKGCLAASDIRPLYGKSRGDGSPEVIARLSRDRRVYVPGTFDVIWPRQSFPETIRSRGPVVWIETVACELLDKPDYLDQYLRVRARERMKPDRPRRPTRPRRE
ncbi:MAG: hypothetical protein ABEL76_08630, partial [Bradymonadaceae bacterium]